MATVSHSKEDEKILQIQLRFTARKLVPFWYFEPATVDPN